MDIWSWISELPSSDEWNELHPQLVLQLASPNSTQSIQLRAERTSSSNSDEFVTFSLYLLGFHGDKAETTLWVSDTCPLSSDKPFLPLVLQLLQEIVSRSPTAQDSTCRPSSGLQKLKPDPVLWVMDSHSPESFSGFFNLVFLTRLFWLCVFDAPSDVGYMYFYSLLAPNLETFTSKLAPILRTFLVSIGVDVELCFMRTLGYILAKWLILREVGTGLQLLTPQPAQSLRFSYALESHGLWVLKGYAPVWAMKHTRHNGDQNQCKIVGAQESVLRYALAHQQLEAVVQLEYTVRFSDGFILVNARVDNIRIHVAKLGFKKNEDDDFTGERHFPSRIRLWVGPEIGSNYVGGLSLGRSTDNVEREMEMQRIVKGSFGKLQIPKVKALARTAMRTKMKNWRWDQDAEGNTALFDAILCDNTTGTEVATWRPSNDSGQHENNFRKRYTGANRSFTKTGGLVFTGDECGGVGWRLGKEMEGSVLKWRIGCEIWLSYWPNDVRSSYFETRRVEWCDEVDLPLIAGKGLMISNNNKIVKSQLSMPGKGEELTWAKITRSTAISSHFAHFTDTTAVEQISNDLPLQTHPSTFTTIKKCNCLRPTRPEDARDGRKEEKKERRGEEKEDREALTASVKEGCRGVQDGGSSFP
ncbi:Epstein-Barr nuclear antigen 2 like [Actinidia chinensis var. chinensis]|uniref:Epstein-Barr nuclear antigen 2 like n=1 Tax=Actinidia chinensis var. chinensis TaxID=1590841 RepID=A0A2R6RGY9_ACTCC|nr:Epstein-Barr nuclear antigen 2 like [Actinidia chinensis var. chinensis]